MDAQETIWQLQHATVRLACEFTDGSIDCGRVRYRQTDWHNAERWSSRFDDTHKRFGVRRRRRIVDNSNARDIWCDVLEQTQPFATHREFMVGEPREITARMLEARHKALCNRIGDPGKYDGNRARLTQQRDDRWGRIGQDHVGFEGHKFLGSGSRPVEDPCCPTIIDTDVIPVYPAQLPKAGSK